MVKNLPATQETSVGSIPASGRSPGGGNDKAHQNSCLENPMDRGAWRGTVHGVARVGHKLVTKQQQNYLPESLIYTSFGS